MAMVDQFHDCIDGRKEHLNCILNCIIINLTNYRGYNLYTFHPQAIDTAKQIVTSWLEGNVHYSILLAQMQSGKTGTYTLVSLIMYDLGLINSMYIICGVTDKLLKKQTNFNMSNALLEYLNIKKMIAKDRLINQYPEMTEEDITDLLEGKYRRIKRHFGIKEGRVEKKRLDNINNKQYKIDDGIWLTYQLSDKFTIAWSQDLKKLSKITNKSLVISEESHYANSKSNRPFKQFWKSNKLHIALCGDFTVLNDRDIYILSVSATPFSEWSMNERISLKLEKYEEITFKEKNVFLMEPGLNYKGIKYYLDNNRISFTAEKIDDDSDNTHLKTVIRIGHYVNKYILVRVTKRSLGTDVIKRIADDNGYGYKELFADSEIGFSLFDDEPDRTMIVVISGKGRMGQDFSKEFIGMIYEGSKNPNNDTALQAGPGRMCGYGHNGDIDIYVSVKCEMPFIKYAEGFYEDAKEFAQIKKVRHIKSNRALCKNGIIKDEDGTYWKMFVPMKFKMSDLERDIGERILRLRDLIDEPDPSVIDNLLKRKPEILVNLGEEERQYIIDNIGSLISDNRVSFRFLNERTYIDNNTKENLDRAILQKEATHDNIPFTENINDKHTDAIKPITIIGDGEDVFILGFSPIENEEKGERTYIVAEIKDACIHKYTDEVGEEIEDVNGVQPLRFPAATSTNPDIFKIKLKEYIERTQPANPQHCAEAVCAINGPYCSRKCGYDTIKLRFEEELLESIIDELQTECRVTITFINGKHKTIKKGRKLPGGTGRSYNKITWVNH
jgi:hypothetical protein